MLHDAAEKIVKTTTKRSEQSRTQRGGLRDIIEKGNDKIAVGSSDSVVWETKVRERPCTPKEQWWRERQGALERLPAFVADQFEKSSCGR